MDASFAWDPFSLQERASVPNNRENSMATLNCKRLFMTKTRSTVYLYTSLSPPLVLLLPHYSQPRPAFGPIYGPNRCFHELWRLNIDPISLFLVIWQLNKKCSQSTCENWEEHTHTHTQPNSEKHLCTFEIPRKSRMKTQFEWQTNQERRDITLLL